MSTLRDIRSAIVATMQGVAGIGVVHAHEPYAKAMDKLKSLYVPDGETVLHGWFVRREAAIETGRIIPRSVEYLKWRIQGVYALDDAAASELAFDDLLEDLRDAFRANDTLGGTVAQCAMPDGSEAGLQVLDAGPVMFAGVLCHAARCQLTTQRYLSM